MCYRGLDYISSKVNLSICPGSSQVAAEKLLFYRLHLMGGFLVGDISHRPFQPVPRSTGGGALAAPPWRDRRPVQSEPLSPGS